MLGFFATLKRFFVVLFTVIVTLNANGMGLRPALAPVKIPEQKEEPVLSQLDAMPDTYSGVDALGRRLSSNEETGDVRSDRFVGMFYWDWHVGQSTSVQKIVNVNEICKTTPEAITDPNSPVWQPFAVPNFWNESIFGYYKTDDKWVLRRHAEMLANAGVDVIFFDNSNGTFTWKDSYEYVFEVFDQARKDGVKTPQISFLLPFADGEDNVAQLRMLYEDIFSKGRYQNLWFYWKGKPLIMANNGLIADSKDKTDMEIYQFFTFRPPISEYYRSASDKREQNGKYKDKNTYWSWLSIYPQPMNTTPDGKVEQMAVGTAQNYSREMGLTAMNGINVFGRTYTSLGYDTRENAALYGANFSEQFEYALKVDPEFIFITGWNEWIMGRFEEWQGVKNAFPDHFNDCFSRDIEPSKGDLGDNYYYQTVNFIRRFKGTRAVEADTNRITVNSIADFANAKGYYAYKGNTFNRDALGYTDIHYTDYTGRNDIAEVKTASDNENLYFYVRCTDTITPSTDENWMRLLLDTSESDTSWEGYEYIINRTSPTGNTVKIERSTGGFNWEETGEGEIHINDNALYVKIPKTAVGITETEYTVNYKWTDNTLSNGDIFDFYLHGDSAPMGRFNYVYKAK